MSDRKFEKDRHGKQGRRARKKGVQLKMCRENF